MGLPKLPSQESAQLKALMPPLAPLALVRTKTFSFLDEKGAPTSPGMIKLTGKK